ncbi:MAG: succinylglutamate desuccinylase/aspartoacylase family protein [Gammaproteobacteria bacterium]|nr:succinylglutamate desuccinylase/aspartoacylase family protein [Gammaproteobacteria bacterium]
MEQNIFDDPQLLSADLADTIVYDTQRPGAHLVIFSCVHGNEPVGLEASNDLYRRLVRHELALLNGKITFIFANRPAYQKQVRFVEQNLNRAFLEEFQDTLEGRRAQAIEKYLATKKVTFVLDLHSIKMEDLRMLIINRDWSDEKVVQLSETPIVVKDLLNKVAGSTMHMSDRLGCEAMAIECGDHLSPNGVRVALRHIDLSLHYLGMMDTHWTSPEELPADIEVYNIVDLVRISTGFRWCIDDLHTGKRVPQGTLYAESDSQKYIATEDLHLLLPNPHFLPNDVNSGMVTKMRKMRRL